MKRILIIDDEKDLCQAIANVLKNEGYEVIASGTGEEGIKEVENSRPELVLLDLRLPGLSGMEVLKEIKKHDVDLPVIILTGFGDIKSAVESIKLGAFNYITKPFINDEIVLMIRKAFQEKNLNREVEILRQQLEDKLEFVEIISKSEKMKDVMQLADKVAPTNLTALIQGESGTGKELLARYIHLSSLRKAKPFIAIDCGSLPEELVESELFGFEKGAFTGADRKKLGQFELAHGGTLFLDEIGNLPVNTQPKLLRALQEMEIQHLGGKHPVKVDIRIIAASNIPIEEAVRKGTFRDDLFHRLNEFSIYIPPLRERIEDISLLAGVFMKNANMELSKQVKKISNDAMDIITGYGWPGNTRELKNTITRAVLLADYVILPEHLPNNNIPQSTLPPNVPVKTGTRHGGLSPENKGKTGKFTSLKKISKNAAQPVEKDLIAKALRKVKNRKNEAAKLLGISRKTLYNKMKEYGI